MRTRFRFDVEQLDAIAGQVGVTGRKCLICGASLDGKRSDADYCGDECRTDASVRRRLRRGDRVAGYSDLESWLQRRSRGKAVKIEPDSGGGGAP